MDKKDARAFIDELATEIATENDLSEAEGRTLLIIALRRNRDAIKRIAAPTGTLEV